MKAPQVCGVPEFAGGQEFALVQDFAIIMAVAGVVVVLFHRLKQPPILGYLLAGLLIGPFTPLTHLVTNTESIRLLADLGLVLLLFALGLEFGWRRIRQVGLSVLLISFVEMLAMVSLGYMTGRLLGWTSLESIFLGAALSISSSAILAKVLRDMGKLQTIPGRLIVGILVLEDFVAVVLLTLLSGIATTSTAGIGDIGSLVMKLAIFGVASLALGALFVPRIIKFVAQFHSREAMLLASLALCFALALLGQTLGMSAAAGAFLIGAVVGDTEESEHITDIIQPIRDMFGALFFVSIGMLIDIHLIKHYLVPTVVISLVFLVGKMVGNTVGTFATGHAGRVPIRVGMGMPQMGEFSLAMMKVGVEQQAIGAFMYQVIAGVTAITSLVYPYIVKSTERVGDFLERRAPTFLRRDVSALSLGLRAFSGGMSFDSEFAQRVRHLSIPIGINFLIIVVLVGTGTFAVGFAEEIAGSVGVRGHIVGDAIGVATLLLCLPSSIALWRGLRSLADEITKYLLLRQGIFRIWVQERLRVVIRDFILIFFIFLIGLWFIPFVWESLSLGFLAAPVPLVILLALVLVAIRLLTQIHGSLVATFSRTFLGEPGGQARDAAVQIPPTPLFGQGGPGAIAESSTPSPTSARQPSGIAQDAAHDVAVANQEPLPLVGVPRLVGAASTEPAHRRSLGEAEMIALSAAREDRSPYRRWRRKEMIWDIKDAVESRGYYRVTLTFREADSAKGEAGEEELYVDYQGNVRVRQIRHWPSSRSRRMPLLLLGFGILLIVASGVGIAIFALIQNL